MICLYNVEDLQYANNKQEHFMFVILGSLSAKVFYKNLTYVITLRPKIVILGLQLFNQLTDNRRFCQIFGCKQDII